MVSFRHYVLLSTLLTLGTVWWSFHTRVHFYSASMFLASNKLCIVVGVNSAFMLLCMVGKSIKRVFLGTLLRDEIEELVQSSKYAITETMLALTIFREDLSVRLMMLFTALLFIKIFHWLAAMRVEACARTQAVGGMRHVRLLAFFGFLFLIDLAFVVAIGISLLQSRTASVLLLFGFEYLILTVMLVSSMAKYALLVWDARVEARGQHWANKNAWMFYLEFTADLVRLFLYLLFFLIVCTYYGLPLHLIRELSITFYNLRERIVKFIRFRRVTKNMQERFADATAEDLAAGDKTCIVCREDMDVGQTKKLPCAHMFHFACLRTWLERSQSCPTCRHEIPVNGPPLAAAAGAAAAAAAPAAAGANPNAQAGVAGAAAGAAAAAGAPPAASSGAPGTSASTSGSQLPPGMPPLPPHLLEALRLAQAQQETSARENNGSSMTMPQRSASPLHPLFGSTPTPLAPQSTPHSSMQLQYPSPPHAHLQQHLAVPGGHAHGHGHAFMSPMHPFTAAAMHGPAPGAAFMFPPPPPPPPPAHLFPLGPSPLAMSAGLGMSSPFNMHGLAPPPAPASLPPGAFPSAALYGSYLSHHGMLLQHHLEFLQSSLRQVQILVEQQRDVERRFKEQQAQQQSQQSTGDTKSSSSNAAAAAAAAPVDSDSDDEPKLAAAASDSTLTQRRGVKTED